MPWAWGQNTIEKPSGVYHLVWSRDLYQVATAQLAAGLHALETGADAGTPTGASHPGPTSTVATASAGSDDGDAAWRRGGRAIAIDRWPA